LLSRELGVRQLAAVIFNYTVGSGIFVLPAVVAAQLGPSAILAYLVCAFIMAFLGGILAFNLVAPPSATAQSTQAQVVRASAFELVADDGTVIGRLMTGPGGGGNLELSR